MKKILTIMMLAFVATVGFAANKTVKGNSTYKTKSVSVNSFTGISLANNANVTFTQISSGSPSVSVEASSNLLDLLSFVVKNGILYIAYKSGYSVSGGKVNITVKAPKLQSVSIKGSGNFKVPATLNTDKLDVNISGSGNMTVGTVNCTGNSTININGSGNMTATKFTCKNLDSNITGSGDCKINGVSATKVTGKTSGSGNTKLQGKTSSATLTTSGKGDVDAKELKAKDATANVSGSGNVKVQATNSLNTSRTGTGTITYSGDPKSKTGSTKGVSKEK